MTSPSHSQGDVAKVIRYSRKLPEKEGSLVKVSHIATITALSESEAHIGGVLGIGKACIGGGHS